MVKSACMKLSKIILGIITVIGVSMMACSPNNVTVENGYKKYFDEEKVTGTFGLFDNGTGQFTIYNLSRFKDSSYLPASTFKIVNSLIGIETGRVSNEKMVINWDGVVRVMPGGDTAHGWNKDLTMEEAIEWGSSDPEVEQMLRRELFEMTGYTWID